ncbi:MAG: MGMT family protein [Granulosicoccus sp.]
MEQISRKRVGDYSAKFPGALAKELESPNASRAVGMANGANPIPILIPCHRVIGSTGKLTGFGGGIKTKRFLLDLENSTPMLF